MREIKIRGYAIEEMVNSQWIYGTGVHTTLFTKEFAEETGKSGETFVFTESGGWIEVYPESVGQFTGLQDKNGKDIYEGDLIKKKFKDLEIGEFYAVGQVVFGKWYAGFTVPYKYHGYNKLERLSSEMDKDGWLVANRDMEVVGNVYKDPELLGGADK